MKILVYDIETLLEMFLIVIYNPETDEWIEFEVSEEKTTLDGLVKFIDEHSDYYWVGYNNLSFDSQIVEWILREYSNWYDLSWKEICSKISQKAQDRIDDANFDLFPDYTEEKLSFKQIDLFTIWHFNNKNRRVSLKRLEFEMDVENVEEMPIIFNKSSLSHDELQIIRDYCHNDVLSTFIFYKFTIGEVEHPLYKDDNKIELRESIQEEFGISCLNYSNAKIGDEIIKKFYCEDKNIDYKSLPKKGFFRKQIHLKHCIPSTISFKTPQLQKLLASVKNTTLSIKDDYENNVEFYGQTYTFAKGGLHNIIRSKIYECDENTDIVDVDVSGYYPATIINYGYYPFHLGKEFLTGYSKIYYRRIALKPLSKTDKRIKGIVGALKEAGNCPYGKSSDVTSWLYDKQFTLSVCITGELSLLMLIEECELNGCSCIMANTDGATFLVPKDKREVFNEIKENWKKITTKHLTYEIEETEYKKMIFSTVNDYIAIKKNGEIKRKGDYVTDFELHKNKSASIIPITLSEYFINGIPVEETIKSHTNIYDFCIRQKSTKDFHYEGINRSTGERTIYNKLIRYYVSDTGEKLYKIKNPECTTNAPKQSQVEAGEWLCRVCNYLPKNTDVKKAQINYNYYIEKAEEIVRKVEGKKKIVVIPGQMSLF